MAWKRKRGASLGVQRKVYSKKKKENRDSFSSSAQSSLLAASLNQNEIVSHQNDEDSSVENIIEHTVPYNLETFIQRQTEEEKENIDREELFPYSKEQMMRLCIAFIFDNKYNATQDRTKWKGKSGIVTDIRRMLNIPLGTKIDYIFEDLLESKIRGSTYTGTSSRNGNNGNLKQIFVLKAMFLSEILLFSKFLSDILS